MTDKPTANLVAALVALQADLPEVKKTETAKVATTKGAFEYQYAGLAAVSAALLPRLAAVGLAFTARPTVVDGRPVLAYELRHTGGETIGGEYPLLLPPNPTPQTVGSSITYGRRYCLCAITGLVAESDDDGAAASAPSRTRTARARDKADPAANAPAGLDDVTRRRLMAAYGEAGIKDRADRLAFARAVLDRELASSNDLSPREVAQVIAALKEGMTDRHDETPGAPA